MSDSKQGFSLRKQVGRSKKVAGALSTMVGGFRQAYRIDAFREPPRDELPKYIQVFCDKMCRSFGVEVVEVEPVPQVHALWASNHISWMDIPVMGSVSPAFFLSKAEIGNWPIFGHLARAAGTLFIERGSGDAGSVSEQITDFLRRGYSVVFFPEATTTNGHRIKRIHGKLLQAAMDANMSVQPIVICYVNAKGELSEEVPYFGKLTMKESLQKVLDSKGVKAYVLALEPLQTEGKTRSELTNELQQIMQTGLETLHRRVLTRLPEPISESTASAQSAVDMEMDGATGAEVDTTTTA